LAVEVGVQPGIPRLVERRKFSVFDEGTNTSVTGYRANLLVVASLITEENRYFPGIPLGERRGDLRGMFSGRRHVEIEDSIRSRLYEQCDFQLLNPIRTSGRRRRCDRARSGCKNDRAAVPDAPSEALRNRRQGHHLSGYRLSDELS
jgi:hypothetical protein